MIFENKFTTDLKKLEKPEKEKSKMVISDDAFAIGIMIQSLIYEIKKMRSMR